MSASSSPPTIKHVLVRHRDPSWMMPDGTLVIPDDFDNWNEVPFVSVDGCPHETTICDDCIASWDNDYALRFVFTDGDVVNIDDARYFFLSEPDNKENPDGS